MDDSITSKQTEKELLELALQLIPLMKGVDMQIMKFYSNSKLVMKTLDPKILSKKVTFGDKDPIFEESKVLGMSWDADTDLIRYISKFKSVEEFFKSINLANREEARQSTQISSPLDTASQDPHFPAIRMRQVFCS